MKGFTPVFKIFKEGVTNGYITIVKKDSDPFNVDNKKAFYLSLGYTIKSI